MKNSDHVKQHSAEALNKHPFLQGFSEQECEIIKACASFVEFEKHSRILQFQAPANCFYLLEYGQVCLFNHISRSSTRPLETLSAPSVLGWSWLMAPYLWHFDAEANTCVLAHRIDVEQLRTAMKKDVALGLKLYEKFVEIIVHRLQAVRLQNLDVYQVPQS